MRRRKRPDFLSRYLRACGRTEVPTIFHKWSCISLIAACLGDRVWFVKHADSKLYPNLYVTLIGESASGKGTAISRSSRIAKQVPEIFRYRGKATGAHLSDVFSMAQAEKEEKGLDEPPSIYLVFPEMSDSIGEGPQANDFIKRFTNIFEAEEDVHQEGTRTHGALQYRIPIANCLFGTTEEWLYESVSRAALRSGWIARNCVVKAEYDPSVRIHIPEYPANYNALMEWLVARARQIARLRGPFTMTEEAVETHRTWYEQRPYPDDKAIRPSWKRADDLFYKLAMIMSVSKGRERLVITSQDATDAIALIDEAQSQLGDVIHGSHRTAEIENLDTVALYIRQAGVIPHAALLKRCAHHGIPAGGMRGVNAQLRELIQRGEVKQVRLKGRTRAYGWRWVEEHVTAASLPRPRHQDT